MQDGIKCHLAGYVEGYVVPIDLGTPGIALSQRLTIGISACSLTTMTMLAIANYVLSGQPLAGRELLKGVWPKDCKRYPLDRDQVLPTEAAQCAGDGFSRGGCHGR